MVISEGNKSSYFYVNLQLDAFYDIQNQNLTNKIENSVDIVLAALLATDNVYKFKNNGRVIYLFSTENRKRKGQLDKLIDKNLIDNKLIESYETKSLLKSEFNLILNELKQSKDLRLVSEPNVFPSYNGNDVKFLDDRSKWYGWQTTLYNELFYPSGEIRPADARKIIFVYDPVGNSGKSMWMKYLYTRNPQEMSKVSSGTAAQLRSQLINMGSSKRIYFIDLPRSKEKYSSDNDILNVCEDAKIGHISSPFFGKDASLIMEPPHIIVISNYLFPDTGLSRDRWSIYEIDSKKNFKDITQKVLLDQAASKMVKK